MQVGKLHDTLCGRQQGLHKLLILQSSMDFFGKPVDKKAEVVYAIYWLARANHKNEQDRSIPTGKRRKRHDAPEFGTSR